MRAPAGFVLLLGIAVGMVLVAPSYSYLPDYTAAGASPQPNRWDFNQFPVVWNLNPAKGSNVSGSRSVADVMTAAFATWKSAPNAALQVSRGPDVAINSEAASPSNVNLICFVCSDADFSKDSQTLAVTITTTADGPGANNGHGGKTTFAGQIIKADIIFNPSTEYNSGGGGGQDLLTVATHEIGHFFGLGHSPVVRSVMFPSASDLVQLSWDDVAGISHLYPKIIPDAPTGAISGTVRRNGGGIFGAHVYADSITGAAGFGSNIRKSPIGAMTRPDGSYTIDGLPPGDYAVTAEPVDGPASSGDITGYPKAFGQPSINSSFTTRSH